MMDTTAKTVADILMTQWVSHHGVPQNITTDRGSQFTSNLMLELSRSLGVHYITTTAYHPQGNGKVERFHHTLKAALMSHAKLQWTKILPLVLLQLRVCIGNDGFSPSELHYGSVLRIPGQLMEHQ